MELFTEGAYEPRRMMLFALPLLLLVCLVGLALATEATLIDNETQPDHDQQYYDWAHAYNVQVGDLGTDLVVRRDGGGDPDYLRLPFLSANDMVTVNISQRFITTIESMGGAEWNTTCEYYVSDPNKFPIVYYNYLGKDTSGEPNFTLKFAAIVSGDYFIHTEQGFGNCWIIMNITVTPMSPPSAKDNNNKPSDKALLTSGVTRRTNAGLPWDPSDFYYINIQPTAQTNKYLTIQANTASGTELQWEVYDNVGLQRTKLSYDQDALFYKTGDRPEMINRPITIAGDYNIRVWMKEGYGQYNLTVTILSYANDQNNSIEDAYEVDDNTNISADVNLSFDREDWTSIYVLKGQPLWVRMKPHNGPADVFVFDELGNQKASGDRRDGLEEERINGWAPEEDGYYYILVEAAFEAEWPDPPNIQYTLEVWLNYYPQRVQPHPKPQHNVPEDTVNTEYDVTILFTDKDDEPLVYDLDMRYNNTLIDIQLLPDNHLRIEPVANASDFKVKIWINATDPRGLWVNQTVTVIVDPINDPPFVDQEVLEQIENIDMGEDLVKENVNVTRAFRDIDDDYSTWNFEATTTDYIKVELDEDTWLATFTPLVEDWFGDVTFEVTCTDKGGESVTITFYISMSEINDPPYINRYVSPIEMDEETSFDVDLEPAGEDPFFLDPEEKPLTYGFANNQSITVKIVGSVVTFTGQKDFYGTLNTLVIWAIDDVRDVSSNMTILITVDDVPDAPNLTNLQEVVTVEEGTGVRFSEGEFYEFFDIDSTMIELQWKWYVDDVQVPPEDVDDLFAYEYVPPVTAEKERTVKVTLEVIDSGVTVPISWTINVLNRNAKPSIPVISVPDNKTVFKEGESISFTATATDMDGDELTFKWFRDMTNPLDTGPSITVKGLEPGKYRITVEVSDTSGATSSADYDIEIKKKDKDEDGPGFEGVIAVLAIAIVIVVSLAYRRRR